MVLEANVFQPRAVLEPPVVLSVKACHPRAVLEVPVVLESSAVSPIAILCIIPPAPYNPVKLPGICTPVEVAANTVVVPESNDKLPDASAV